MGDRMMLRGSQSPNPAKRRARLVSSFYSTTVYRGALHHGLNFQPTARRGSREASIRPAQDLREALALGQRCVTPRQACPRPNGFGRNLRSKTRWFTGFCNSHQVSHFATFFIDARAEISVAESHFRLHMSQRPPHEHRLRVDGSALNNLEFLGAFRAGVCCLAGKETTRGGRLPTRGVEVLDTPCRPSSQTDSRVVLLVRHRQ